MEIQKDIVYFRRAIAQPSTFVFHRLTANWKEKFVCVFLTAFFVMYVFLKLFYVENQRRNELHMENAPEKKHVPIKYAVQLNHQFSLI